MQDNYVGDIGDYGKYGLLRAVTASGLRLAVNWYYVVPKQNGKQDDGKYISYLSKPEEYRHYDPELFDRLSEIVMQERSIEAVETGCIFKAQFFREPLSGANRKDWHNNALLTTAGVDVVFIDPDNGLETARMYQRSSTKDKHAAWQEVKDYYDRGQSVILYHHRPQRMTKENCIQRVLEFQYDFLQADDVFLLEYPRYTNLYYFIFAHAVHQAALEMVYNCIARKWKGLCSQVDFCRPAGDR